MISICHTFILIYLLHCSGFECVVNLLLYSGIDIASLFLIPRESSHLKGVLAAVGVFVCAVISELKSSSNQTEEAHNDCTASLV